MVDDDGSFLSRRLRWGTEADPESTPAASGPHRYDAEAWDDEIGGAEGGRTEHVAAGGGVTAGRSFERRDLDRMDEEALDRRRQLWRDTALLLSVLLVVLAGANLVLPGLGGGPGASPTPIPTGVVAGGNSAAPSAQASEPGRPSAVPSATPHSGPSITQPPTGTAAPTHPGATPRPTHRPTPRPTSGPPTPAPTRAPAPTPTPGPTPEPTPQPTPEPTPAPPVAAFTWSQAVPLIVSFTNTSSGETEWLWDFGDGSSSTQQNPEHTYLEAKDYVVRLTVTGPGGSDFVEHTVSVSAT